MIKSELIEDKGDSPIDYVQEEIVKYLHQNGFATQAQVLKDLSWPSVLVSSCIGFLVEDNRVKSKMIDGQMILFDPAYSHIF